MGALRLKVFTALFSFEKTLDVSVETLPGSEAVQTGSDVLAVVVHLLAVGGALLLQTGQSLLQPQRVCPAPLAVQALVSDVLP